MSKLWRIPNEWDYHQLGAIFVVADTAEEAVALAKAERTREGREDRKGEDSTGSTDEWGEASEITNGVWFQDGCDD